MVSPNAGSKMMIQSYKHSGQLHRVWKNSVVLKGTESVIIGANDRTKVIESDGHSWMTREPAICYFDARHWFNIIGMLRMMEYTITATSALRLFMMKMMKL